MNFTTSFLLFLELQNLKAVKLSHDAVLAEMENLNKQLQTEQSRTLALQTELKSTSSSSRTILEVGCTRMRFCGVFCTGLKIFLIKEPWLKLAGRSAISNFSWLVSLHLHEKSS